MTSSAADGVSPETARELEAALVKYLAESGGRAPGKRRRRVWRASALPRATGSWRGALGGARRGNRRGRATRSAAERDALAAPYAQLLGAIAHAAGSRFGAHAFESLPCVVSLLAAAKEEGSESTRETCLRTLERFAEECPRATAAALPAVVAESLRLVSHDPLYGEEGGDDDHVDLDEEKHMDADEHMDDDDDGSEYGSEYDASEYSDDGDDDASWKIRRGAARVLRAVSAKAPFALEKSASDSETNDDENKSDTTGGGGLFVALVRKLIVAGRRERDESCRLGGFRRARSRAPRGVAGARRLGALAAAAASVAPDVARSAARGAPMSMTAKDKARGVKPTFKTRTAAFGVLHRAATCVPGAFASDTFGVVAEACAEALESTSGAHIAAAGAGSALDAGSAAGSPSCAPPRRGSGTAARFFDGEDASAKKRRCASAGRWRRRSRRRRATRTTKPPPRR